VPTTFAKRLAAVAPSATLEMNARANAMRARGIDVYAFGVGEPDFEPPRFVLDAAKAAIERGASKYTAVSGIEPLKQAICDATLRSRKYAPDPGQVTVSVGAKHALFNLAIALYESGDEVIIPAPCWLSYPEQVRIVGATPVIVETAESAGWRMSPNALERALTPRTKAVVLCSPSNPTGAAYPETELKALLEVLAKHDCWIIADEIYAELVYDGFRHVSAAKLGRDMSPSLETRIVAIDGVSKQYAMTGWRIGWSISPPRLARALEIVQGQTTTNATAIAQHAAVAALTGPQEETLRMRTIFEKRRNVMIEGLNAIPGIRCRVPEGAFYAFADCRGLRGIEHNGRPIATDLELATFLLEKAHVASVPGDSFGAPGYIRFSYATSEERIAAGIASIRAAVESARGKVGHTDSVGHPGLKSGAAETVEGQR
jgi:aspartate aminotransferase